MADGEFDMRAHRETYASVMKLTTFTIAALIVILVGLALGVISGLPLIGFGGMILGLIALTIWALISG
jgi:hypothetical protein